MENVISNASSGVIPGGRSPGSGSTFGHSDGSPSLTSGSPGMTPSGLTRRGAFALGLGIVALAATPALAHPPTLLSPEGHTHTVEEIMAFRRELAAAVAAKDVAKLRALYADSFTHTHTSSKVDGKDARIVSLLAGEPTIELAPAQNLKVNILAGGWVAVAVGVTPITAMSDGKVYAVHWTATYTRAETGWQLAASQATRGREFVS